MDDSQPRITVTPEQLERNFRVWLKVMPLHLWRPYQAMLAVDPTRRTEEHRVDPHDILAAYLREKFTLARWTATYPERAPVLDRSGPA
ncbi:MAG TPA: hypothetical protein VGB54_11150 [Allosphingosinicella sp.]|jgi:hypothetical protein